MKHFKPNVVRGGTAIGLGDNLFLMKGRKHSEGGIDVGENPRTGLEVEDNEVMQVTPKGIKVFSAQPILGGKSPAQYILEGASPYNIFNAQEAWKKFNGINDDGTQKKADNRKEYVTRRLEDYDIFDDNTLALRQRFMESNFVNDSISPAGAKGAYQIIPHIYNAYVKRTGKKGDLTNYEYNKSIRDWLLAEDIGKNKKLMHDNQLPIVKLAKQYGAYNWGSGNLQKYLNNQVAKGIDINNSLDWLEGLPKETRNYINFIVLGKDANKYKTNSIYNETLRKRGIKSLGGSIHIKPSKRGTFTAAAKKHGMSVQGFASKVLANKGNYSPSLVKKANFARNASKWHKKELGGQLNNNNMTFDYLLGSNKQLYRLGGRKKAQDGIFIDGKLYDRKGNVKFDTNLNPLVVAEENRLNTVNDLIHRKAVEGVGDALLVANGKVRSVNNPIRNIRAVSNIAANNITSNSSNANENNNMPFKVPTFLPATKADKWDLGLNLAGNLLSTITNGIAIGNMQYPTILPLRADNIKTRFNINPQLNSIRESVARGENDTLDSTASSRVSLARRNNLRNWGNLNINNLYGQKENIETSLINQNIYNRQSVGNQNISNLNNWRINKANFDNRKRELLSENIVSGITNAVDAVAGERGYLSNIENRRTKQQLLNRDYMSSLLMALSSPNSQFVKDLVSDPAFVRYARENGFTLPNIK